MGKVADPTGTASFAASAHLGHELSDDLLVADGIVKSYGENAVLRGIDLRLSAGEVVALAGENGAGKSTLLGILSGLVTADNGTVTAQGVALPGGSVSIARRHGITIVPQELAPVPDLPIYANVFLGRELRTRFGMLDRPRMIRETRELLHTFELDVDPRRSIGSVNTATQQLVEILKCVSTGSRIVLLDEPTSAITETEVAKLFEVVADLRRRGVAVVFTTHRMAEIRAIADRVIVLRDGVLITDASADAISDDQIVEAMIGRELGDLFPAVAVSNSADEVLQVEGLRRWAHGPELSFSVRAGEIVGLAGLLGAGRTGLLETIFGARPKVAGAIRVDGRELRLRSPADAITAGVALVPEDRKGRGLVLSMSILRNGVLPNLPRYSRGGWFRSGAATREVRDVMASTRLNYARLRQDVGTLSGGNQQKVVLGRWLAGSVRVLLLDEPTRGVDVGARSEIYQLITSLASDQGIAVVMASSDMAEVIGLAHRILVMRGGDIVHEISRDVDTDAEDVQEQIFRYASGMELVGSPNG